MPAKPPPNVRPHGSAVDDPSVERQDSELAAAGRQLAEDMGASSADEFSSAAERRAAERSARRRQRAEVHDAPASGGHRSSESPRVGTRAPASLGRDLLSPPVIAVIAGGLLGVILGALSVGGWIIGLLAAALAVVLLRALSSPSRSTSTGTK